MTVNFVSELNPIPTEEVCTLFNELRSDIVVLNEIKNALSTCMFEIQTFKHQYEAYKPEQVSNLMRYNSLNCGRDLEIFQFAFRRLKFLI